MASTHILATGKIEDGGDVQWHIAPLLAEEELDNPCHLPGYPVDHAACPVGNAELAALRDGTLQAVIDYGAELEELIDGMDETEWIRGGC